MGQGSSKPNEEKQKSKKGSSKPNEEKQKSKKGYSRLKNKKKAKVNRPLTIQLFKRCEMWENLLLFFFFANLIIIWFFLTFYFLLGYIKFDFSNY